MSCGCDNSILIYEDGYAYSFGNNRLGKSGLHIRAYLPTLIPNTPKISFVVCSLYHTIMIDIHNRVFSFGLNNHGQLELEYQNHDMNMPTLIPDIPEMISAVCNHTSSFLLSTDGDVYSFGWNSLGKLGLGDYIDRHSPTKIPNLPKIKSMSCGDNFVMLLDYEGSVYSFGSNFLGELGLGDNVNRDTPTKIPNLSKITFISSKSRHTFMIDIDNDVYTCGCIISCKKYTSILYTPTKIDGVPKMLSVSCGNTWVFMTSMNRDVYFMGQASYFHELLGLSFEERVTIPMIIPNLFGCSQIICGDYHIIFIDNEGNVYSAGDNTSGQLGLGVNVKSGAFKQIPNFKCQINNKLI